MNTNLDKDGNEYHLILNAIDRLKNVDGLSCEIGLRLGGGSQLIMNRFIENNDKRIHVAIDPYGNIPYSDINGTRPCNYTNQMKNQCLKDIYNWCYINEQEFLYFPLESEEYFNRFVNGIPIYLNDKKIVNKYCFVHIDGQHTLLDTMKEFSFFCNKISPNGIIIFDDINNYNHDELEQQILNNGYSLLLSGNYKKGYIKNE